MVTITSRAKKELKRVLETRSLGPGNFLRLATPPEWTGEGDFGIVIDIQRPGDIEVGFEEVTVLLVNEALDEQLPSAVFDFKESDSGSRFTLDVF